MADWCLPCKEFESGLLPSRGRRRAAGVHAARVDLTREDDDPALAMVKSKYDVNTLPAVRVVSPEGHIVQRFDTIVDAPTFLKGLARR